MRRVGARRGVRRTRCAGAWRAGAVSVHAVMVARRARLRRGARSAPSQGQVFRRMPISSSVSLPVAVFFSIKLSTMKPPSAGVMIPRAASPPAPRAVDLVRLLGAAHGFSGGCCAQRLYLPLPIKAPPRSGSCCWTSRGSCRAVTSSEHPGRRGAGVSAQRVGRRGAVDLVPLTLRLVVRPSVLRAHLVQSAADTRTLAC